MRIPGTRQVRGMEPHFCHVPAAVGARISAIPLPYLTWPLPGIDWPIKPVPAYGAVVDSVRNKGDKRSAVQCAIPSKTRRALEHELGSVTEANKNLATETARMQAQIQELQRQLLAARAGEHNPTNDDVPADEQATYAPCWPRQTWPRCYYGLNHLKVMKWFKPCCPKKPGGLRPCKPYTICVKPFFFCFKPYFFLDDLNHY